VTGHGGVFSGVCGARPSVARIVPLLLR
jgi:hypothetical protein